MEEVGAFQPEPRVEVGWGSPGKFAGAGGAGELARVLGGGGCTVWSSCWLSQKKGRRGRGLEAGPGAGGAAGGTPASPFPGPL